MFGTVVGNDGAALPGVTVTLTGVGAPQTTVTDAQGRFRFPNLSPGTYSVKAELSGYGTATRSGIGVRIGGSPDIAMTLNPSVSQTITVTAEAPLLDVRKTGTGNTVSRVELETVPSGRDPWVILQQTPGVLMDRINIGGNESGQQSNYVSKGVTSDQTAWNVDGVNITDVGALGSSPTYYDFDSFEEVQITTGGTDVRIQTPGAQLNMVTKRGTNDLSGSGRYFMTSGDLQDDPEIPAEANDGTTVPSATNYLAKVNEIDDINDMGIELGGPVIRDRLWLWGAYSNQQIDLFVAQPVSNDPRAQVRYADKTELETYNFKLNAQPIAANSLSFAAMLGNKVKLGRNIGPSRPPETAWNQDSNYSGPTMWKIEDTHVFSSNFYLTGLYSKVQGGFQLISDNGEGCQDIACGLSGDVAYWDLGDPLAPWANSYYNYNTERPQDQYRLDGSTFFNTGGLSHELKFGFGYRDADVLSQSGWPGDQFTVFYGGDYGSPGDIDAFAGVYLLRPANFEYNVASTDLYLGDTMMFGNLTLQAGLRWDKQEGSLSSGTIQPNPTLPTVLPGFNFSGDSIGSLEWSSVSPRIGLTYALGAEKKTLLRAAANRYHDQLGGFTVYGASPLGYQYLYLYFTDANGNRRAEAAEIDASTVGGFLGLDPNNIGSNVPVRRWDPDMEVPHTDELLIGAEREFMTDFVFGATYTWRKLNNFIETRAEKTRGSEDWYTNADYVQNATNLSGTLPDGTAYSVPYYRLRSGVPTPTYFVFRNADDYSQTYSGLELTGTKRMSNRWMLRASLTLQDWSQEIGENYIGDPTRLRNPPNGIGSGCSTCDGGSVIEGSGTGSGAKGGIYINSEWAYNLTGAYQVPFIETSIGFNLTGRQGYPIPYVHRTGYIASEQTFKYVLIPEDPTDIRHEDVHNLDLRLAKDFRFGPVGTTFSVDVFNVFNEQTILQRNTRLAIASANRITEMQSPRVIRLGARLTF